MSAARAIFGWQSASSENQGEVEAKGEVSEGSGSGTAKLETGPVLKPATVPSATSTTSSSTPSTTSVKPSSLNVKGQNEVRF